ncbi:MAG: lysylphosphatidylglycerol synthase domain-containing protein [Aristaeellaceae bacterium]
MGLIDKAKAFYADMRRDVPASYKSIDTEEPFDKIFTKPMGYLFTRFFIHIKWTPNMVTILSMFIGVLGGVLFYPDSFGWNLVGVLLVIFANILDSTDGQMARLTGQKSALGRILDGMSSTLWYIAMYIAICCKLYNDPIPFFPGHTWGWIIWAVAIVCGLLGHAQQCTMADRYRNIHLFFLKNKHGDELHRSEDITRQRHALPREGATIQRIQLFIDGVFTLSQERITPTFQKLFNAYLDADEDTREGIRQDYLAGSRKYIQLTNVLTFNARAYLFFALVLLNVPALYFLLEFIGFGSLKIYTQRRYEQLALELLKKYNLPGHGDKKPSIWNKVFFAVGVVGVIVMLMNTDFSGVDFTGTVLRLMPLWLPSLLCLWGVIYVLHSVGYGIIMGWRGKGIPFTQLLRVSISGFALNHVTPVGLVGGEFYRIMEMKPALGTEKAVASTLTFTVMNTFSHVMFWFSGAVLYLISGCPGAWGVTAGVILMALACGAGIVMFLRYCKRGLVVSVMNLLGRLPLVGGKIVALMEKKSEQFEEIDRDMEAFYHRHWDFWMTTLVEYAARMLEAAEFWLIFLALDLNVPYIYCVVALSCASLVGNLLAFIPMQIGTREMGLALAMSWVGLASPLSLTASIMSRIREIIYTAAGTLMMLVRNGNLPKGTKAQVMDVMDGAEEDAPASNTDWEPPISEGDWQPGQSADPAPAREVPLE